MRTYFNTTKAYWDTSTNAKCNAGGILMYADANGKLYHVTMCVHNDTVIKKFSGHNKDKKEVAYTNDTSLTGNSTHSIEYYVFNNVSDN